MRLTRSRSFAFLLLFCLFFAQMAAGAHALSHLPPAHAMADLLDAPDGDGKGASHVCLECLSGQGLDFAAAPAAVQRLTLAPARGGLVPPACVAPVHGPALRPNSRAPPAFL
jgi:hypothetical protein